MRTIATLAMAMIAGSACADVIISNIADADNSGTRFGPVGVSTTIYKAGGFMMGAQDFQLDSVAIDISDILVTGDLDVSLYSDAGGAPGSQLVALSSPTIGPDGVYTMTPNSAFTLEANTSYWVYVNNPGTADFLWDASNATPTGAHATSIGYHFNGGVSSFMNKFEVNGSIPAPASALALGALGLATTRRRR